MKKIPIVILVGWMLHGFTPSTPVHTPHHNHLTPNQQSLAKRRGEIEDCSRLSTYKMIIYCEEGRPWGK